MAQRRGRYGKNDEDLFRCRFVFNDRKSALQFVRQYGLDVIETGQDKDKRVTQLFLLDQRRIKELADAGHPSEVLENASETSRERQREVGRGDRFSGGKLPPAGLGKKIKGGD